MVHRRRTKFSLAAEQESINSFLRSENQSLKKKNEDLAKALSETKIEQQKLMQNSLELHERLYSTDVERIKFKEFIKALGLDMRTYIQHFFSLTEQMTNMLNKINIVTQSPEVLNQFIDNPSSTNDSNSISSHGNKTMAVMPMVSGHTILSPKINLPRITVKQLTDMVNNSNDTSSNGSDMDADEIEFADNVLSNNEDLLSNSEISNGVPNPRLETMQEEDDEEQEQHNISNSQPLLSGVFKDIKVYISPMSSQHIVKFKNKTRRPGQKMYNRNFTIRSPQNSSNSSRSPQRNHDLSGPSTSTSMASTSSTSDKNITQSKNATSHLSYNTNNASAANGEDYDPMEGTSKLCSNTQDVDTTFVPTPNETSTPRSPPPKASKPSSSGGEPRTPHRHSKNVSRRKRLPSKMTSTPSNIANCSVKLQKMSSKLLKSYASSTGSVTSKSEQENWTGSPTVLEKSTRSSTQVSGSGRKRSSAEFASPKPTRSRRQLKLTTYKEPSLNKKMRR